MKTRGPSAVKSVRWRTLGSGTRVVDEIQVPMVLYHGGRLGRWLVQHWRGTLAALVIWGLWWRTDSLVWALVIFAVGLGLTQWLLWRNRATGGAGGSFSVRDAAEERLHRKALRTQWPLACKTAGLTGPDREEYPVLHRVKTRGDGTLEATVRSGMIGVPVPSIQKQTGHLAEVIGCREVVVAHTGPGVATVAFHWRDPVGRQLPLADLPVAPEGTLAYGIRQDTTVATIRMRQSVLIGGLTRMGKSNAVWALLADAIRQQVPVDLYISDPKGGVELDAFEGIADGAGSGLVTVREYAKTAAETVKMIESAEGGMHKRQWWMKQNGVRAIERPDSDNPLVVIILDETLPLTDLLKKGTDSALGRIAYTGSAAAYVVWANTQVAQVDSIGRFRDLVPQKICFATPNPQVTDSVLGQGSESMGAKCSEIRTPGVGYSYSEGQHTPRKFRSALVTDDETRLIALGKLPQNVVENAETDAGVAAGRTALYRWFYADDPPGSPPQYIGISSDVLRRDAQHSAALREFAEGNTRRTVEWWPTRKAALDAERKAIEAEKPTFNQQHNTRNPRRRVDLRRRKTPAA